MKTNAVVRIVIYSLVILILIALLCTGLGVGMLSFDLGTGSGEYITGEGAMDASRINNLEIDWAAGSVTIVAGDVDQIIFSETRPDNETYAMAYTQSGSTLKLSYSRPAFQIGFVSMPAKDLVVTVPYGWDCRELELDGAALDVEISGLTVGTLDIDGAANTILFNGSFTSLTCDGADCDVTLVCTDRPRQIDLDGAACKLELTLPKDCGFLVQMDGLACDFRSDFDCTGSSGDYSFGDRYCQITADGLSCDVYIRKGE